MAADAITRLYMALRGMLPLALICHTYIARVTYKTLLPHEISRLPLMMLASRQAGAALFGRRFRGTTAAVTPRPSLTATSPPRRAGTIFCRHDCQ